MSKILANQIANYGDDSPIEIKEGLNIPAGKPIQAAGIAGNSGQVLTSTGVTVQWTNVFDGDYGNLTNKPTIPAAQINSDWNASGGVAVILNKPVVPALPSIVTATASSSPSLSYNAANGEFTYTPPDLSSYATESWVGSQNYLTSYTETDPVYAASAAASVTTTKITNWDNAYGWGDHSGAGYLTSLGDAAGVTTAKITNWDTAYGWGNHAQAGYLSAATSIETLNDVVFATAPSNGQVLKYDGSNWIATTDLVGSGGSGIILSDLSVTNASASGGGSLAYNNALGVFTFTPPDISSFISSETDPVFTASAASGIQSSNISNWDAAHGWGDHAGAGYLTSETSHADVVVDGDFTSNGLLKRDSAGSYSVVTDNSSNWDTAHGWGDHSQAGYLTGLPAHTHTLVGLTDTSLLGGDAPSDGDVLTYDASNLVWKPVAPTGGGGGGGASVTIADTAPAATAGDLWWESDRGRLKIYYQDTDSAQWVDVSPPLSQITTEIASGSNKVDFQDDVILQNGSSVGTDNCLVLDPVGPIVIDAHIIPFANNTYDIGTAERKIRDIFEDQGSDVRIKEDFEKFIGGLDFINSLEVVSFTYKDMEFNGTKAGKRETGLIAQNVKDALDKSTYESYRLWNENPDSYQGLDKKQLIPALVNAIQELNARVDDLFKELEHRK